MQATRLTLLCHARTVAQKLACFPTDEPVEMDWQSARGARAAQFKKPRAYSAALNCARGKRPSCLAAMWSLSRRCGIAISDAGKAHESTTCKVEPESLQAWLDDPHSAPHGGESVTQLGQRVAAWLTTLEATPGHIVAITHPFVIRAALTQVLQSVAFNLIDVEPLSAIELRFNGCWRLRLPGTSLEGQH